MKKSNYPKQQCFITKEPEYDRSINADIILMDVNNYKAFLNRLDVELKDKSMSLLEIMNTVFSCTGMVHKNQIFYEFPTKEDKIEFLLKWF